MIVFSDVFASYADGDLLIIKLVINWNFTSFDKAHSKDMAHVTWTSNIKVEFRQDSEKQIGSLQKRYCWR